MKNKELFKMLIIINLLVIPAGQMVYAESEITANQLEEVKETEERSEEAEGTEDSILEEVEHEEDDLVIGEMDDTADDLVVNEMDGVADDLSVEEVVDDWTEETEGLVEGPELGEMDQGGSNDIEEVDYVEGSLTAEGATEEVTDEQALVNEEAATTKEQEDAQAYQMNYIRENEIVEAEETISIQQTGDWEKGELEHEENQMPEMDFEDVQAVLIYDEQGNVVKKSTYAEYKSYDVENVMKTVTKDGLYVVRIQEKDGEGQIVEHRYVYTINKAGTSFRYDQSKANVQVKKFVPEIAFSNLDEVTILSCMMNGKPAIYQIKEGQLQIDRTQLRSGKNRITLDVKDRSGNVSSMMPWEFFVKEGSAKEAHTVATAKTRGSLSAVWKSIVWYLKGEN